MAKAGPKKAAPQPANSALGRRGPPWLAIAWLLLIAALGGVYAWNTFLPAEDEGPPPAEPFYLALPEPEPPPAPPPVAEAPAPELPPMAPPAEVKEMTAQPPMEPAPAARSATAPAPAPPATTTQAARPAPRAQPGAPAATPAPQASPPAATPQGAPPQVAMGAPAAVTPPVPVPPQTWQRFARPFDANDARPRIAVVIVDLGLSSAATEAAIQHLPGGVTLAFSPYADGLENWLNLARAAGHEVMLGLPMEPANFPLRDPGPRTLLTSLTPQQNLERLDWVLGRASGIVGLTNHMGSRFTASTDALRPVLTRLRDRGLIFLDARTTPRSVAAGLASQLNLPRAINDRLIDQEASRASIDALLSDIEKVAKETGNAVAMGQPYPVTFERLAAWLPTLEGKGIALAPVSAVVNRQPDR